MEKDLKIESIPASLIVCNPFNPRRYRTDEDMQELSDSIRLHGLLQPITVRSKGENFEIVCGERRFRASVMAGLETVPSIVKDYSDEQAMEVCILENLQRKDISPIEEAEAFGHLYGLRGYTIETLAKQFGKSETYIRGRLQLRNLIEDAAQLLVNGELSIANALELSRYNQEIQADIHAEHLAGENYYSWKELSAAAFRDRLEHHYSNSLANYSFDLSDCETCRYNSAAYDLFTTDKCGNCQNAACLKEKQLEHMLKATIEKVEATKDTAICLHPYSGTTKSLRDKLDEKGYEIVETYPQYYPNPPQRPTSGDYPEKEALDKAMDNYWMEMAEYTEQMEDISRKAGEGRIQRMIDVSGTRPVPCYRLITPNEWKKDEEPVAQLRKKDMRNREIAIERTVEDLKKFIRDAPLSDAPFTEREQDMLYFIMLSKLKREHLVNLGFKDSWALDNTQKYDLLPHLTDEHKRIICRDFIASHLSEAFGTGKQSDLLVEFATLHYPEQTAAIQMQYYEVYEKRHERIMERIQALEENQPLAACEDTFYEEIEAVPLYNGLPVTTFEGELADVA